MDTHKSIKMEERMKIGTITFHWASNYGAVLQAYALQQYLMSSKYETEIINYIPLRIKLIYIRQNIKEANWDQFIKQHKINRFCRKNLKLSKKTYYTNNDLKKHCNNYDIYICGSDQIWNETFTLAAEGRPTLSYYLNFVKEEKIRISYATSFGTDKLPNKVIDLVKPELAKFAHISVREKTGEEIIEEMGLKATLTIDPTLLLESNSYKKLIENKKIKKRYQLFSYILHENQTDINELNRYIFLKYFDKNIDKKYNQEPIRIIEWLYNVKNSKFVVTNSFHAVVFSIIFHTPFIAMPVEDSGMNDRIPSLLNAIGLGERFLTKYNEREADTMFGKKIEWDSVDDKLSILRKESVFFLEKVLRENID